MSMVIKVREMLDEALLREQENHCKTHSLEEGAARENTFCINCKKPIPQGNKVLLCHYAFELAGWTSTASFCHQECHDEWFKMGRAFRDDILWFDIILQIAQAQAFIAVFGDMFSIVQERLQGGEGFRKMIESIELPTILWEGVELTEQEQEHFNQTHYYAHLECQAAIAKALGA